MNRAKIKEILINITFYQDLNLEMLGFEKEHINFMQLFKRSNNLCRWWNVMKKLFLILLFLNVANAKSIEVEIKNIKKDGTLNIAVCDKNNWQTKNYQKDCVAVYQGEKTNNIILEVPDGEFIFQGFLDENQNNILDTNFFGIPKEQYFFTKKVSGQPDFDKLKTLVNDEINKVILK